MSMGILQARTLKWVAKLSSRGSSQPRDQNPGLQHCRWILYHLSHQEVHHIYQGLTRCQVFSLISFNSDNYEQTLSVPGGEEGLATHLSVPAWRKLTTGPPYCSVPQSCLFATPWTAASLQSLSCTISWSLLKIMSTESMMPSSHLILCCPLLFRPSIFPSISLFH